MTWSEEQADEVLRVYQGHATRLIKRLNAALADPPPSSSGLDPLLQAAQYDKLALQSAWKDLRQAGVADQQDAERGLRALGKRQTAVNRIASERAALPPPPDGGFKLNELPNWHDVRLGLLDAAAKAGADERFAESYARRVGRIRIDVTDLNEQAEKVVTGHGEQVNALARSHLRKWAGGSLCQVLARFNEPRSSSGPASTGGDTGEMLREQEESVWQALRSGGDGLSEVRAYADLAKAELGPLLRRLQSLPDGSEELLVATLETEEVLEAMLLARYFRWFLGWGTHSGLDDGLRQFAQLPFESEGLSWESSLGVHRYRSPALQTREVRSATCATSGTSVAVASGEGREAVVAAPNVDLSYFGFTGTGHVRLGPRREGEHAAHLVDVPIEGSAEDWRSTVRQRVRGMYNPVPFGLSVAWGWSRGQDGALAQVTSCGWFS